MSSIRKLTAQAQSFEANDAHFAACHIERITQMGDFYSTPPRSGVEAIRT
jgi:hypothetical protein